MTPARILLVAAALALTALLPATMVAVAGAEPITCHELDESQPDGLGAEVDCAPLEEFDHEGGALLLEEIDTPEPVVNPEPVEPVESTVPAAPVVAEPRFTG